MWLNLAVHRRYRITVDCEELNVLGRGRGFAQWSHVLPSVHEGSGLGDGWRVQYCIAMQWTWRCKRTYFWGPWRIRILTGCRILQPRNR